MKIGLLSDTHSDLDPKVFYHFKDCDEIWHAGDLGDAQVLKDLQAFKPVRAVYGNIDDQYLQARLPLDLKFTCEGVNVWITHIGGKPPRYNPRVKRLLLQQAPDLFICGHSHILLVHRDVKFNNMLFVNPGAAGNHGFHQTKTMIRFEIAAGNIRNMEVVELGKRGALRN